MVLGETVQHARLKTLALGWAQASGFPIAATEVRVPRSGYRADVAAIARGPEGRSAVFECKQARADLLKDACGETEAREKVAELGTRLTQLEQLIGGHRPDLRKGESLFAEYDAWDFSGLQHATHRHLVAELATWQQRLVRGTKFARLFRWRAADYFYLVTEEGILAPAEIPVGWGLLVRRGDSLALEKRPIWAEPSPDSRLRLLESIAVAATRAVNRLAGISPAPFDCRSEEQCDAGGR